MSSRSIGRDRSADIHVCGFKELFSSWQRTLPFFRLCFAAALVLFGQPHCLALDPSKAITQYHLDVWTEREGLPQGSVQAITQTRDGYIWIGTRDGLARFDGVSFTVFTAEETPGLASDDVRALHEDREGNLWIGTFNGGLIRYQHGQFVACGRGKGSPSEGVLEIFEDHQGKLWLGTWNGLARFEEGRIEKLGAAQGLNAGNTWSIAEDSSGTIWAGTHKGIWSRREADHFTPADFGPDFPRLIRKLFFDRAGALWVGTIGDGLLRISEGKVTRFTTQDNLPDNKIGNLLEDKDGNLWIGTWGGLSRFRNGQFSNLTARDGFPHDYIETLFEDREGSLWIGTRGAGLARLRDGAFSFYTTREGLAHNSVKCILQASDGAIWIGYHGGGLDRGKEGRFEHFGAEEGLASNFVWALAEDARGRIWAGTGYPPGLQRFENGRFVTVLAREKLPVQHGIRAICVDPADNVWFGGDGPSLARYHNGELRMFGKEHGIPTGLIRTIARDRHGAIWIGTGLGLCRQEGDHFICYTTRDGLSHNAVYSFHEDQDGTIWLGTQDGLSRFRKGVFAHYGTKDGLFQELIYQLLEDSRGNLWMSSNRGVFSLSKQTIDRFDRGEIPRLTCNAYGAADGMKSTQCDGGTAPAGCQTSDGRLWFPTTTGLAVINPNKLRHNPEPPPVLIEKVVVADKSLNPAELAKLKPDPGQMQIHYTALSFVAPEKVLFKYRLEGLDDAWTEAGARRVAYYNKLPPGQYRFRVIACNNDGVWNEAGASFAFYLAPHFYQQAWFFLACAAAVVLAAWSFHRRRMRQAEAEFSLVLAERSRIARDLHDTLAQAFAGIGFQLEAVCAKLVDAPAQAQQHLGMALEMVRHSLGEARRTVMNLRSQALGNGDLANAWNETARQIMGDQPVDFQVQISGVARPLPPRIENDVLRIGQEAITNALRHASAQKIHVTLEYHSSRLVLRVADDGRGFSSGIGPKTNGTHFGLLGMRERARQIKAQLHVKSRTGEGTEVILDLPIHGSTFNYDETQPHSDPARGRSPGRANRLAQHD